MSLNVSKDFSLELPELHNKDHWPFGLYLLIVMLFASKVENLSKFNKGGIEFVQCEALTLDKQGKTGSSANVLALSGLCRVLERDIKSFVQTLLNCKRCLLCSTAFSL